MIFENNLSRFDGNFLLFDMHKQSFFQVSFMKRTLPYLYPNTIHFDAVDFSECRSKEVMVFF